MSQKNLNDHADQLALAAAITAKANTLCEGLETGEAAILDRVTPVTADLLRWWFSEDMIAARGALNFHAGQRQAILNAIVAHELQVGGKQFAHPKYCFKMATGTGKTWVLQALMIWQLLNKTHALAEDVDDGRFTRHFMVVAPGLIVYERLLDAFYGKPVEVVSGEGVALTALAKGRDFATSDMARYADLFVPEAYRETVFGFVRGNVCSKAEIGLKATGNGMIAITNWHLLVDSDAVAVEDLEEVTALGITPDPKEVISRVLPLTPGRATGNSLEVLDRRYARGNVLAYLADLPELMVFNDEAHHIHEFKREGEVTEVEWQKSLTKIAASKGQRFVQMDFSATPYNDVGSGKNKRKVFFPHIITDFDLKAAMRQGLVKSLVLDKRKEIGALPLDFKAQRDEAGNPSLSEGQRVMLRAGLTKLRKLQADFAKIDPTKHPKMLVVCEDTTVSPLVENFLTTDEGLAADEVMCIDSGKKAELGEKDWAPVRARLFNVDQHTTPKVIVSVLMLREGFDVNNICVIVPLRTSQAQILLEQTIGRGLRLMWRESEYHDIKRENRERINAGQEPGSLLDVLSIIEHPAFQDFYNDLIEEGLVGVTDGDGQEGAAGDVISVGLREDYVQHDFAIPFILQEADELRDHTQIDITQLPAFTQFDLVQLEAMLGKGDQFISQDLQSATLFGGYRIDGALMTVTGYNDYLSRLTKRISSVLGTTVALGSRASVSKVKPYMQVNTAELTGWLDDYIWTHLFGQSFNPQDNERWRILLLSPVLDHLVKIFADALREAEDQLSLGDTKILFRRLSEASKLAMRESCSVAVSKSIYQRLGWPSKSGGLEKTFIYWAQADTSVLSFCKLSETRHTFARLRYVKDDGLSAFYSPDFLVKTQDAVYLVETKAQDQLSHPNVLRKRKAALAWCERINSLTDEQRTSPPWHYALLGEETVHEWQTKNGTLRSLLDFARYRPSAERARQQGLI